MNVITDLLLSLSGLIRPHLTFISSALVATFLVIYGNDVNRAVWALIRRAHFIVRTLVFILLCAIGYGLIAVYLVPVISNLLLMAGSVWLGVVVVLVFILVGWLAERHSRRG
ncbi:DUF3392 family protein [Saccharospirillum impatiens]|uniref:DUF3392 family protein n=1 Tax=Saccharospirillum impatiens TaxID=169438 RepID=UPI0003F8D394|nr:DUF3392 family protein [Saccharospirillum impatiens]